MASANTLWAYLGGLPPQILIIVFLGTLAVLLLLVVSALGYRSAHSIGTGGSQDNRQRGSGGKGGNAKVGGNGIAIGGPGGQVGKYGKGGDGGGGEVTGDGIAAGGAGGSSGDDGIWRPPAKSGYELSQRALGLAVDPNLRQFGRGGAMPGYEPKLQIIEELRVEYFRGHDQEPQTIFENLKAVPLDYLNEALAAKKEAWRARIVDDEYEFFIPGEH